MSAARRVLVRGRCVRYLGSLAILLPLIVLVLVVVVVGGSVAALGFVQPSSPSPLKLRPLAGRGSRLPHHHLLLEDATAGGSELQRAGAFSSPRMLHRGPARLKGAGGRRRRRSSSSSSRVRLYAGEEQPQPSSLPLRTFHARDIQIKAFLGELAFLEITDWDYYGRPPSPLDPSTPSRTISQGDVSIRLFDAVTLDNERVVLKEYPASAGDLARADLAACALLRESWEARGGGGDGDGGDPYSPPFVWLMGSLVADESFASARFIDKWFSKFSNLSPPRPGNVWLVFAQEAPYTLASFARARQAPEFWDRINPDGPFLRRCAYLKRIARLTLSSLGFVHESGLYHRSLGASSVRLTSVDERFPALTRVKLCDFGFSARAGNLDSETTSLALKSGATTNVAVANYLIREDLRSAGFVLLDLFFTALSVPPYSSNKDAGANVPPSQADGERNAPADLTAMRKLVDDIFKGDVRAGLRGYCMEDEAWNSAVRFLDADGGAGWEFLEELLRLPPKGSPPPSDTILSARGLLSLPFLQE